MGITERKEREKEQRRKDIIDAAERVFFSKGYDESTMDDVAEEAELSKGTLYLYFRSKDELHFAIMEKGMQLLLDLMESKTDPKENGRRNLRFLGMALVEFSKLHPHYFNALIFFQSRDLERQKLDEFKMKKFLEGRSSLSLLNDHIIRGMNDGSIRKDIGVEKISMALWAQMMGVLVMYSTKTVAFEHFKVNLEDLVETHLQLIQDGLKPQNHQENEI